MQNPAEALGNEPDAERRDIDRFRRRVVVATMGSIARSTASLQAVPPASARIAVQSAERAGEDPAVRQVWFRPTRIREGEPELVKRRRVQRESLAELAQLEKRSAQGRAPRASTGEPPHGPRVTRLEHVPAAESDPYQLRSVRERLDQLSAKQRELLRALEGSDTVSQAAVNLGVSRSNVYASLRRISRKLGVRSVPELLAIVRTGELFPSPSS